MKNFISALGFLTLIPIPRNAFREDGRQIACFPWVGLLLGLMLAGVDKLCSLFMYPELRAIVDILFMAAITGALHLDGLADTADGVFAHRSRERALEIMKDPRIGVMGTLAIIFCLLLKIAGIYGLQGDSYAIWLITAPVYARTGQVAGLIFLNYARQDQGKSQLFFQKGKYALLLPAILPLLLPFYTGILPGITVLMLFLLTTGALLVFFQRKLGGMTGDTLGALTEITEMLILIIGGVVCMDQ